ncbi:MAG TPA: SusD/RagB family nutrient-binding outer membrane lipoprotein [Christiangramia sp.]|nr:SusD/RagB family nutrient-binding outer membrane lipoprotein [Christiangramia sp.]
MKRIFKFILIAAVLGGTAVSCSDYLDINDPKNDPTLDQVSPDLILAGALTRTYATQAVSMNQLGNVFMNNWGANVNAFTGGFNEEYQLIITSTFYNNIWDQLYVRMANFQSMIDSPAEGYDNHQAIAKIMKSFYMQYIVDLYGDAPYSMAFNGGEGTTPMYDDDAEIYRQLIVEIDEALEMINAAGETVNTVGAEDIVYGGDMQSWITFANTLKLRILIRQSELAETDGETASYLTSQFASLQGASFITSNATINPGYANDSGRQNPFFGAFGYNVDGSRTTTNRFVVASLYAESFLDGSINGVQDPRISRLYSPVAGEVQGVEQGIDSNDPSVPASISPLGPGLIKSDSQDGILFSAASSYFLQSEAVVRGYLTGDAKGLFENGIRASFAYLEIPSEVDDLAVEDPSLDEESYIAAANAVDGLGWDASSNKIEAIMTQKWLALNGINAIESWIEYTRTGYPEIPLAVNAQRDSKPNRLLYPSSEYIANSANVPTQQSADAFNTSVFWDVQN